MDLSFLNKQQEEAVINSYKTDIALIATPGSGKTSVLTTRIAYLVNEMNVDPDNILAITFTNKAANEMKERTAKLGVDVNKATIGTFHSVCLRILKMYGKYIGLKSSFTIMDTYDTRGMLGRVLISLGLNSDKEDVSMYLNKISGYKRDLITPSKVLENACCDLEITIGKVYKVYQDRCWNEGMLDFDDLLIYAYVLLSKVPEIRSKLQNKYKYILVDEFQDSAAPEIRITQLLKNNNNNLFVVGDLDQAIYSFRGAKPEQLSNYKTLSKSMELMKLERNYRSTQMIVNASKSLIKHNTGRIKSNMFTKNEVGDIVEIRQCTDDKEEAYNIAFSIYLLKARGYKYSDIAVLYRTNGQSRVLEEALTNSKIPYIITGGLSFFNRKEIKDITSFYKLKANPNDETSFKRIMKLNKGIGDKTINDIIIAANSNNIDLITVLSLVNEPKKIIPVCRKIYNIFNSYIDNYNFCETIIKEMQMIEKLNYINSEESKGRIDNIGELLNIAKQNININLQDFVDNITLSAQDIKDPKSDAVNMMTIHSSKGLEFECIFLCGLEDNLLPHINSIKEGNIEEERRLCYVAMTRAKKHLFMSYCNKRMLFGKEVNYKPSRFIKEIDPKFVNFV